MSIVLSHWSTSPVVLAALAIVAAAHLAGMRAALAEAKPQRRAALVRAAAFYCGLAAVVIALLSPVAHSAQAYIWVRSMQDVLLAVVAPGLIVLGGPWLALRRGAAAPGRRPRVTLVAATATCTAVLAMVLMFGAGRVYPAYGGITHRVLGLVADQNLAGAVLLALALPPFVVTAIALCIRWVAEDDSGAMSAGFDSLLGPSASAWPSWPGYKSGSSRRLLWPK
jgi:cytochrome c oxidase assembly factor CtaG